MKTASTTILALLMLSACDGATPAEPAQTHREASTPAPAASGEAGLALTLGDDWRASVSEGMAQLRAADPERLEKLASMPPRTTRAHTLRFTGPLLRNGDAAVVFLDRIVSGKESAEVRAALVEALPRTGASFGPALVDLLGAEPDPKVRAQMVAALRTADAASALEGLGQGFEDSDAQVRLAAARTAARRQDGASLADALLLAVDDTDPGVKLEAMRSLGALQVEASKAALRAELSAGSADVRLAAVRALGRIDPVAAATDVRALAGDEDARVATAVQRVLGQ